MRAASTHEEQINRCRDLGIADDGCINLLRRSVRDGYNIPHLLNWSFRQVIFLNGDGRINSKPWPKNVIFVNFTEERKR